MLVRVDKPYMLVRRSRVTCGGRCTSAAPRSSRCRGRRTRSSPAFRVVRKPRLTRSKTPVSKANCSGRPTPYNNAVDVLQHTAEDVGVELRLGNYPGSVVP